MSTIILSIALFVWGASFESALAEKRYRTTVYYVLTAAAFVGLALKGSK